MYPPTNPYAARAAELGAEAGKLAAAAVFPQDSEHAAYATALRAIMTGDPKILNLWEPFQPQIFTADDAKVIDLAGELGIDPEAYAPVTALEIAYEAADAWQLAAGDAFMAEVERAARAELSTDEQAAIDRDAYDESAEAEAIAEQRAELYAEAGMSWIAGGGNPADASRYASAIARGEVWDGGLGDSPMTGETCPHGLDAGLCADPVNHYPPDM
jgi:hypothetical protein